MAAKSWARAVIGRSVADGTFYVIGGGGHIVDRTVGTVNEGDDTGANPEQAENVDIAPRPSRTTDVIARSPILRSGRR